MRLFRFLVPLILLAVQPLFAQQNSPPHVPNSPKGLNKQYQKLVGAVSKGKETERRVKWSQFVIPSHWFTDTFGKEQGPDLAQRYTQQFDAFVDGTLHKLRVACVGCPFVVKTRLLNQVSVRLGAANVAVQRYKITKDYIDMDTAAVDSEGSWDDSFIYVDGAFRFFGRFAPTD